MSSSQTEHVDEIIPGVWLGNRVAAADSVWLRDKGIQAVFNCTKDLPFHPEVPFQYRVPVDDNLAPAEINAMEAWAPEIAYKILREYKSGHPILIHCFAGRQRSAAACAFFLLVLSGKPLNQIVQFIQSKRNVAFFPRPNFAQSMRGFEEMVRTQIHVRV